MYLIENQWARQLHAEGLAAELSDNFGEAHKSFHNASMAIDDIHPTVDSEVQLARIVRDDGFTYIRSAVLQGELGILFLAEDTLQGAKNLTESLLSGTKPIHFVRSEEFSANPNLHEESVKEVLAEHGATLGLLGRLATVKSVMFEINTRGDAECAVKERKIEQRPYGQAHRELRKGNNGYYRVSNSMAGARQERLNGQLAHTIPWLGRAVTGLTWTAAHDRRNLRAAVKTFTGRLPHLRSYEAAQQSVLVKP